MTKLRGKGKESEEQDERVYIDEILGRGSTDNITGKVWVNRRYSEQWKI